MLIMNKRGVSVTVAFAVIMMVWSMGSAHVLASDVSRLLRGGFTALVSDELGVFVNPAGLLFLERRGVHVHGGLRQAGDDPMVVDQKHVSYFEPDMGIGAGALSVTAWSGGVRQYAYSFAKGLGSGSVGLSVKWLQAKAEQRWAADVGYVHDVGAAMRFGMNWRNAWTTRDPAPRIERASPREIALGVGIGNPRGLAVAVDYVTEGLSSDAGVLMTGGQIRLGPLSSWVRTVLPFTDETPDMSYGLGIEGKSMRLDVGFTEAQTPAKKLLTVGFSTFF